MEKFSKKKFIAKKIVFGAVAITAITFIFMQLWNWLMPVIFGLTTISFLQSLGLLAMSKILFGRGGRPPFKNRRAMMHREKFMKDFKMRSSEVHHQEENKED
ncbi:hypothetical protein KMW28_18570 [Flammeovirga yaeyamensis]|uniref:Uncharacterized protein n=1 Tax=Flammeovirga yaeyamensis TaxID=367791 RepID=A0AAX1N2I3_9BACT|nr:MULTISPECIES: hypothetical protein [Flammeovirga]ANQ50955.1 hypothetical protein MY04_3607 [Flammeovirga sp. MY04]MBB3701166.1 hypothetical protein [Flammeovirga yaeyamensis]NMF38367.1 hypothetical protein [Flammeovirga yaeyamensis]QWG01632.1 hypothetical protein KMW28_18570 [Flammeovirga yaeyamensis]